jgi:2-oxoglutarate dehydrogenase complex dehydrogenase (E1) component-like enzyme
LFNEFAKQFHSNRSTVRKVTDNNFINFSFAFSGKKIAFPGKKNGRSASLRATGSESGTFHFRHSFSGDSVQAEKHYPGSEINHRSSDRLEIRNSLPEFNNI